LAALRACARRSAAVVFRHRARTALVAALLRSFGVSARFRALPPWLANQRA